MHSLFARDSHQQGFFNDVSSAKAISSSGNSSHRYRVLDLLASTIFWNCKTKAMLLMEGTMSTSPSLSRRLLDAQVLLLWIRKIYSQFHLRLAVPTVHSSICPPRNTVAYRDAQKHPCTQREPQELPTMSIDLSTSHTHHRSSEKVKVAQKNAKAVLTNCKQYKPHSKRSQCLCTFYLYRASRSMSR